MLTATDEKAAHAHRDMQMAVRAAFLAEFAELWQLVEPEGDLDRGIPLWLRAVWPLLRVWFDTSAQQARDYWLEAGGDPAHLPAVSFDPDAAIGSLLVTGPGQVRTSRRLGRSPAQAGRDGLASASRSAGRLVLAGGRDTVEQAAKADPTVTRWQRITDGNPCDFCAMLAGRGAVYLSERTASGTDKRDLTDLARYHDGCGCTVAPVRVTAPPRRRRRSRSRR